MKYGDLYEKDIISYYIGRMESPIPQNKELQKELGFLCAREGRYFGARLLLGKMYYIYATDFLKLSVNEAQLLANTMNYIPEQPNDYLNNNNCKEVLAYLKKIFKNKID